MKLMNYENDDKMRALKAEEKLKSLKMELAAHLAEFPGSDREIWRKTFDGIRDDIGRFEFSRSQSLLSPAAKPTGIRSHVDG
jgi:hypothetical protein